MNADGSTPTLLTAVDTGNDFAPAWSPDGTRIAFGTNNHPVATGSTSGLYVMDANGANQTFVILSGGDTDPSWSPDGTKIAFRGIRSVDDEIVVVNLDGTGDANLTNFVGYDDQPAWSPDGTQIAFTSRRGADPEIFVMGTDGSTPVAITNSIGSDSQPAWQPIPVDTPPVANGKIVFTSNRDGNDEIYEMDADGSNPARLTFNEARDYEPVWSPDGTKIAFVSTRDGNDEIYVMNADGTNEVRLTNDASADTGPTWSPDGTRLAFSRGSFQLFTIAPDGTNPVNLSSLFRPDNPWFSSDREPVWSPDGTRIAFLKVLPNNNPMVYVALTDGSGLTSLTPNGDPESYESDPAWSPDGTRITFSQQTRLVDNSREIYVMGADGSNSTRIHTNINSEFEPTWSPDGSKIAFVTDRDGNHEIYAMGADGSTPVNLTNAAGNDSDPHWAAAAPSSPGPPLNVTAQNTPAGIVVSWEPPASDGGSPITGYTVACTEGDFTQEEPVAADARSATLAGFAITSLVSCTVRATNAAGTGAEPLATISLRPRSNGPIGFTSNIGGFDSLYEIRSVAAEPRLLVDLAPASASDIAYAPDGSGRIAFSSPECGILVLVCVMDGDGGNIRARSDTVVDTEPAWSPDGKKLAYTSFRDGAGGLFVANASGATITTPLVTIADVDNIQAAWSPDGTKIAFVSNRFGQQDLFVMGAGDAAGTQPVRLTSDASSESEPTWSPDGTKIAFTTDRNGNRDIYVMALTQGTIPQQLTFDAGNDYQPDWSPDGTQIAFTSDRDNNDPGIYVMGADGGAPTILVNHPGSVEQGADWSYDRGTPGAPTNVQAQRVPDGVEVTWEPPISDGGAPITGYTVTCRELGATREATTGPAGRSATVTGLSATEAITCTVHASNLRGAGPESAAATIDTPPANRPPTAVLDLDDVTNGTPGNPVFASDDPQLNLPFELVAAEATLDFDLTRSTDPDGSSDIVGYEVKVTGPVGEPGSGVTTSFTPTGTHVLVGLGDRASQWTIAAKITDTTGAISIVTTSVTLDPVQAPAGNRPPTALFAEVRADAAANGLINLDPGLSYDPDPDDKIVCLAGRSDRPRRNETLVDRGEGAPPRAVPMPLPKDRSIRVPLRAAQCDRHLRRGRRDGGDHPLQPLQRRRVPAGPSQERFERTAEGPGCARIRQRHHRSGRARSGSRSSRATARSCQPVH